ncbi:MAG: hypothetical protein ACKPKO_63640, partial [Candidatus Fonsibacter sp.]
FNLVLKALGSDLLDNVLPSVLTTCEAARPSPCERCSAVGGAGVALVADGVAVVAADADAPSESSGSAPLDFSTPKRSAAKDPDPCGCGGLVAAKLCCFPFFMNSSNVSVPRKGQRPLYAAHLSRPCSWRTIVSGIN